ncbi:MAG TPA: hypothetical protein VF469_39000 [Kofleriaceae bacterium]
MWENFFAAGGMAMYPVLVLGFGLLAVVTLDVLRTGARPGPAARLLAGMTFASGLLGTCVGICTSALYLHKVPADQQLQIFALGVQESLHVIVLALMILLIAGLVALVGALRRRRAEVVNVP